eukprot:COSAG02_NODE_4747_length_5030_cov_83.260799_1_plen_168_part_00
MSKAMQSVKEGLVMKKTVKGGKDKGWKQRYVLLKLDSLEYYDKKKKKCLGNVDICGATVEAVPAAKDPSRTIGVRMTHPSWTDGGADVELYIEYSDEDEFSSWKKELDRAVARKSVPGGRGPSHLGWRKHSGSQSWASRDSSTGGDSKDSNQGKGARRKTGDDDDDD